MLPSIGFALRVAFCASSLRGALLTVDFAAVYFLRAISLLINRMGFSPLTKKFLSTIFKSTASMPSAILLDFK